MAERVPCGQIWLRWFSVEVFKMLSYLVQTLSSVLNIVFDLMVYVFVDVVAKTPLREAR